MYNILFALLIALLIVAIFALICLNRRVKKAESLSCEAEKEADAFMEYCEKYKTEVTHLKYLLLQSTAKYDALDAKHRKINQPRVGGKFVSLKK